MNFLKCFLFAVILWGVLVPAAQANGVFKGRLVTEALEDGRNLRVVEPYDYIDQMGVVWSVPLGMKTDGASVPRLFWSLFPPFSGKHRIAAVVHDRYCQTRDRPWRDVHLMFYNAMIAAGVSRASANTMYGAVYAFGPRWSMIGASRAPKRPKLNEQQQTSAFLELQSWIDKNNPTPKEIASYVNKSRLRQLGPKASRN